MKTARVVVAVVVAAAAVASWQFVARSRGPDVPRPSRESITDPFLAEAVDAAVAAARAAPGDADAWAALAMTYDANEFAAYGEQCYRKAVALRPDVARWWYDLAVVLEREDRFDDAATALFRAAELDPSYPPLHYSATLWALSRGRLDDAEVAAQRTMTTSHGATGAFIALGRVQLERGRDDDAAKSLTRALETWPKAWGEPTYVRFLLGTALARLGRADAAAPLLANGAADPRTLPDPWRDEVLARQDGFVARLSRAARLVEANRLPDAVAALEELRRRRPDSVAVATDLGAVYAMSSRIDEAVALLARTTAEHPDSADAAARLVETLWKAGRKQDALREADAAVARIPGSAMAHASRGGALLDAGRADEAVAEFEAVLRLAPTDAAARASIGAARLAQSRPEPAVAAFADALARDAAQPTAVAGMALVELDRGDVAAADAWLAKIASLRSDGVRLVAEARQARKSRK